jgi:hypothetical protein
MSDFPEPFLGFDSPSYTQTPDQLIDLLMPFLSGAEFKVAMYVVRRTFGFKKSSDDISISQMLTGITTRDGDRLDYGTGLSKSALLEALRSLERKNVLTRERRGSPQHGHHALSSECPRAPVGTEPIHAEFSQGLAGRNADNTRKPRLAALGDPLGRKNVLPLVGKTTKPLGRRSRKALGRKNVHTTNS